MEKDEKYTNTKTSSFVILIFFCIFTFSWFLKFFAISYSNYFFEAGLVFVIITTILFIIKKYNYVIKVFNVFLLIGSLFLFFSFTFSIAEWVEDWPLFFGVMGISYILTTSFFKIRNYKLSSIFILITPIFGLLYYLYIWESPFNDYVPFDLPEYKDIIFDDFLLINWFFLTHFMIFITILILYMIKRKHSRSDKDMKEIELSSPISQ